MESDLPIVGPLARIVGDQDEVHESVTIRGRTLVQDCHVYAGAEVGAPVDKTADVPGAFFRDFEEEDRRWADRQDDVVGLSQRMPPPEFFDTVLVESSVGQFSKIAVYGPPGKTFVSRCEIGRETKVERGAHIEHAFILFDCYIGSNVSIEGTHERPVVLGSNVRVGEGATLRAGVRLRDGVEVMPGTVMDAGTYVAQGRDVGSSSAPVEIINPPRHELPDTPGMTPTAWVLGKLADIAALHPKRRLTKDMVRRTRPELLRLQATKKMLQIQPPVTMDQLTEMAIEEMTEFAKYDVIMVEQGWGNVETIERPGQLPAQYETGGGQQLTEFGNDVLLFNLSQEGLDAYAREDAEDEEERVLREAAMRVFLHYGKQDWHPGGTDPLNVGWARFVAYMPQRAVLLEEVQSDLKIITAAHKYLQLKGQLIHPIEIADLANKLHGRHFIAGSPETREWSTDEVLNHDDVRVLMFEAAAFLNDFYPTALSYVLRWAIAQGFDEVYYPTYRTKEAVAEEPPKSIYDKLPKRFQHAPVVEAPDWMEWTWRDASGERPDHPPQLRRLIPNEAEPC